MNRAEQIAFVEEVLNGLHETLTEKFKANAIPAVWDGYELRQYIADKALGYVAPHALKGKRLTDYRNDILTCNL